MKYEEIIRIAKPLNCDVNEVKKLIITGILQKKPSITYNGSKVISMPKLSEQGDSYDFQVVKNNIIESVQIEPNDKVGDIFYVREPYFTLDKYIKTDSKCYYRADTTPEIEKLLIDSKLVWKSAITMHIKKARLFVRLINVQPEAPTNPRGWKWVYEFARIIPDDM